MTSFATPQLTTLASDSVSIRTAPLLTRNHPSNHRVLDDSVNVMTLTTLFALILQNLYLILLLSWGSVGNDQTQVIH